MAALLQHQENRCSKSKLSRRVLALEGRLGVQLICISPQRFFVTEIGMDYCRHCRAMVAQAEAAEGTVQSAKIEPQGIIKATCPPGARGQRNDR